MLYIEIMNDKTHIQVYKEDAAKLIQLSGKAREVSGHSVPVRDIVKKLVGRNFEKMFNSKNEWR